MKNISFSLEPRKRVAVVGLNGAGKTTLIKLILRLYRPVGGRITLGGVDIFEIPYRQYVGLLSVVLQDFALFSYSVRENIVFDGAADDKRVDEAVLKSGLVEKVSSLPRGIFTSVGRELDDLGVEFSGGEGQKLASTRAVYRDGALFILDEPTSALDPFAEAEYFRRLGEITHGKSVIFITHRLSSTVFCDEILVLQGGCVIEAGTHEDLMAVENGIYAGLYREQTKFYE